MTRKGTPKNNNETISKEVNKGKSNPETKDSTDWFRSQSCFIRSQKPQPLHIILFGLTYVDNPSEDQKEEFLQEIEQMKLLGAHQNIVSLVGCCTFQEHKFLVIEYVPFGDLLQWLRRRRRSVRRSFKNSFILLQTFRRN